MAENDIIQLGLQFQQKLADIFIELIPRIASAVLVYLIGRWAIKKILFLLKASMQKRNMEASLQSFMHSMIQIGLQLILFLSIFSMLGINITSFAALLAGVAVGLGAALNGTFGNLAGGLMLLAFKPFKVGDIIQFGEYCGTVSELDIFNTYLITNENRTVILANGAVSTGTIVNYTKQGYIQLNITFELDVKNKFETVQSLVASALNNIPEILNTPPIHLGIKNISNSNVEYLLKISCLPPDQAKIETEVMRNIKIEIDKHQLIFSNGDND